MASPSDEQTSTAEPSSSATTSGGDKVLKKRRVRACDQCRRRKVKCDGGELVGHRCSNCVAFKYECTYLAGTDKRFTDVDYVRSLENELSDMKQVVRKLQLELSTRIAAASNRDSPPLACSARHSTPGLPASIMLTPDIADSIKDEDQDDQEGLLEGFKSLNVEAQRCHFIGRSSNLMLIRTAMDLKQESSYDAPIPAQETSIMSSRRPEFWDSAETFIQPEPPYENFPEPLLLAELIEEFFLQLNANFPLLHRPTFEAGIAAGLHRRDEGFGATVLLVCAIGARFSNNPAVLVDGAKNWHWAGWNWFQQVRAVRKMIPFTQPTVYDLQVAALSAAYVAASAVPHPVYAIIGYGLRLAQDLGAHRRTTYGPKPTVEDELKKRAFWCLVAMDRGMCSVLGRPCSIQDEDFDVELPIECDDEYWITDDPEEAFKQPPGKPSLVSFFNSIMGLGRIHAYALRRIYSLGASRVRSEPRWAQQVVSELDSALNKWIDSVPEHLKWDPNQPNLLFVNQSALLYSSYYSLQITVHRPFIPLPRKPSPLSFPSMAICTNAARSCIHVLDRQFTRLGSALFQHWHQLTLFTAAIILLLNIWTGRRAGVNVDIAKEMEEVNKALRMLRALESRWNIAGRFWDILHDLAKAADVPVPAGRQSPPQAQKRRREDDAAGSPRSMSTGTSADVPLRAYAGSRRVEQYNHHTALGADVRGGMGDTQPSSSTAGVSGFPDLDFDFALPVHSDELGRMPTIANDFDFGAAPGRGAQVSGWAGSGMGEPFSNPSAHASAPMSGFGPHSGGMGAGDGDDANLEAIFSDLLPAASYEDALAALTQRDAVYPTPYLGFAGSSTQAAFGAGVSGHGHGHGHIPPGGGMNFAPTHGHGQGPSQSPPTQWGYGANTRGSWNTDRYMMNMGGMPHDGTFPTGRP